VRRRILLILAVVVLLVAGAGAAYFLKSRERPGGKLDTKLSGVSASVATNAPEPTKPKRK
jgi:flagellar basal body-associated protein FliL